ncbi:MAG: bifunctional precorrin-2 dehydrogenase/sirohydrochlorin ferrochelatase [Nitrospirota bacterium]|nr:bifunctional precorrin-2 dehydrogenase/sirohydrochlorin ferrochelatase [Nitrospirota bacterium]
MKYYPLALDIKGRACVVAGGGAVAERKVLSLISAGASVTVVSPALTGTLRALTAEGRISWLERAVAESDLEKAFLVIAATDDGAVNERMAQLCRDRGILVNVVTSPAASSFLVPSVVEQGDLLIAISTSGNSPALARKVRERLEQEFGPEYAALLEELARLRKELMAEVGDERVRRKVLESVVDSDVLALLKKGEAKAAGKRIREIVARETGYGAR